MADGDRRSAWSDALRMLGRRALTCGELLERLQEKGHPLDDAVEASERAERQGFLDDAKIALRLAERYHIEKSYGRRRTVMEMRKRRLEPSVIHEAIDRLETDHPDLEEAAFRRSLDNWVLKHGNPADRNAKGRLSSHLQRRGFPDHRIRDALFRELS